MIKWYEKTGPEGDIVISTRIRFARNLLKFPFPCKLKSLQKAEIIKLIKEDVLTDDLKSKYKNLKFIDFNKLSETEKLSLLEKHIISPDFIAKKEEKGLIVSDDDSISIMINEEDHIRLQVMTQGLDFESAFNVADEIDTILDKKLTFAFDDKLGYLTQCPTNLGTGMRASVMLHLPGLRETGAMNKIASNLLKLGLTIRGIYGEGTEPRGDIYQLSNQVTLGLSEKAAIKNLKDIAMQLVLRERNIRNEFSKYIEVIDRVYRSFGILKNAKIISSDEFMKLISNVRLGVSIGELKNVSYDKINSLIINTQPATLSILNSKELSPIKRDELRADLIRANL